MRLQEIQVTESSGYSFAGSWTPDLVFSKIWLLENLAKVRNKISTMYVLGAWYGNLAFMINHYQNMHVDKIINVEIDKKFLSTSKKLLDLAGADNVEYMLKDSNQLDYRQLDKNSVVVNSSLTDMPGRDWYDNIPRGTLLVLQGRDHDPNRNFPTPDDILDLYPLRKVAYQGSLNLQDPETQYTRTMVIGFK